MDEGDNAHLCFAFGALKGIYLIDALYARGPTTPTELSPVIALLLVVFGTGELSAFTPSPTGVATVIFIEKLPSGFDTVVGEGGMSLSGGERQRLAIARAILKNAPILILDEATASLDNRAEQEVQMAIEALVEGRTTVVIAHRLSTIRDADIIVVMSGGSIVERGTHEALLAQGGEYARLHALQFRESE